MLKSKAGLFSRSFWSRFAKVFTEEPMADQIRSQFVDMLDLAQEMYVSVTAVLLDPESETLERIRESFYLTDQKINQYEQQIRREVLVHLSVAGNRKSGITNDLLLLNQVKDAERLGDYTKNLFEVFEHSAAAVTGEYLEKFRHSRNTAVGLFSEVRTAVSTLDPRLAQTACHQALNLAKECRQVVDEMVDHPERAENPVAIALLFRYQKRVLGHMRRIATSLFAPFDEYGNCGRHEEA